MYAMFDTSRYTTTTYLGTFSLILVLVFYHYRLHLISAAAAVVAAIKPFFSFLFYIVTDIPSKMLLAAKINVSTRNY